MNLINIKNCNTEIEAQLLVTFLASHQIEAFVVHGTISTIYPIFNTTTGGTILQVRSQDAQKAQELLIDFDKK